MHREVRGRGHRCPDDVVERPDAAGPRVPAEVVVLGPTISQTLYQTPLPWLSTSPLC
jgi:hypothetical protein